MTPLEGDNPLTAIEFHFRDGAVLRFTGSPASQIDAMMGLGPLLVGLGWTLGDMTFPPPAPGLDVVSQ